MSTNNLKNLYSRLNTVGIDANYVKECVLPSWWEDEIAELPTGLLQLKMHLARHLGLDFESMLGDNNPITFATAGLCNFKRSISVDETNLLEIKMIATQAAQIARFATPVDYKSLPANGAAIRQYLLNDHLVVSFPVLLDFCWKMGIPVLHLSKFPKNVKKHVQGMAINIQGKPVIVITKEHKRYAWLLFILAHELGHIVKHHLVENETLIDEEIDQKSTNQQEKEANAVALELLTGMSDTAFNTGGKWLTGEELAETAKEYGALHHIDAGHIALNYGYAINRYDIANKALSIIEPDVNAVALVRQKMKENLDLEQIPEDSAEFLLKISAISV